MSLFYSTEACAVPVSIIGCDNPPSSESSPSHSPVFQEVFKISQNPAANFVHIPRVTSSSSVADNCKCTNMVGFNVFSKFSETETENSSRSVIGMKS